MMRPSFFGRSAHWQTVYASVCLAAPFLDYQREQLVLPDGDFLNLDWLLPPVVQSNTPIFALWHGLEGSSQSHYARRLLAAARQLGWLAVVVHFRGCGGVLNRLPRAYHAGDTEDVALVLRYLAEKTGTLYVAGVSLGGNALLKTLAQMESNLPSSVAAALSISAPLDLAASGALLDVGVNRHLYTGYFMRLLKTKLRQKMQQHHYPFSVAELNACSTFRGFDDLVTAPLHGFRNVDDYWKRASAAPYLGGLRLPTLMIHAQDDPFLPARCLPAAQRDSASLLRLLPKKGGHVGFIQKNHVEEDWLSSRCMDFLRRDKGA
jgi:uncharacterized protein